MNNKKTYFPSWQRGFTYIEGLIAISMTLMASTAIAFSVQKAISVYRSIELKDKAADRLIQYTEDYRMAVAYGEDFMSGIYPRGRDGYKDTLWSAEDEKEGGYFGNDEHQYAFCYLFHDIKICDEDKGTLGECGIKSSDCENSGDESKIYRIRTWIQWDDPFSKSAVRFDNRKNLAFEFYQAVLMPPENK